MSLFMVIISQSLFRLYYLCSKISVATFCIQTHFNVQIHPNLEKVATLILERRECSISFHLEIKKFQDDSHLWYLIIANLDGISGFSPVCTLHHLIIILPVSVNFTIGFVHLSQQTDRDSRKSTPFYNKSRILVILVRRMLGFHFKWLFSSTSTYQLSTFLKPRIAYPIIYHYNCGLPPT